MAAAAAAAADDDDDDDADLLTREMQWSCRCCLNPGW